MKKYSVVAVYGNHDKAAVALDSLINDLKVKKNSISILGRGKNGEPKDTFELKKENSDILFWGEQGALWGTLFGLLAGGFFFFIPGLGQVIIAGHLATSLAGAIAGAEIFGGGAALAAWLTDLGIEKIEAHKYADYLKNGKIVILVNTKSDDELEKIKKALESAKAEEIKVYSK